MPKIEGSWLTNRPGPLQDTQPPNVPFGNWNGAPKGAFSNGRIQLNVPDKQFAAKKPPQWNSNFKGAKGTSRASHWNAQMPQVLFNDHSQRLMKHEYRRGMIINAPVHEPVCGKGMSRGPSVFESISAWGGVFTKPRFLIIVALHEKEYTCIPLYSHNQEGLRGKEHYQHEFVSVQDGRITGDFKRQSNHKPLLTEMTTGSILDPASVAWLTHPISRKYDLNLSVCGRLKQESLNRLAQYMEEETRKGLGLA
ncbi:hypothetical protein ACLMJK_007994 [Lecanora helva]